MNSTIEQELAKSGRILQTTVGESMEPMLHNRQSIVVIERFDGLLKRNDIPLYKRKNGNYVLHRILRVRAHDYIIRGDNCLRKEIVPHEWVIGVMTGFYRDGALVPMTDRQYRRYVAFLPVRSVVVRPKALLRRIVHKCKRRWKREA